MKPTLFKKFADVCELLRSTSKKLEKIEILANFLPSLNEEEIEPVCLFLLGKAFPQYDSRTLNVSWQTVQRVVKNLETHQPQAKLTMIKVQKIFHEIAVTSGPGMRKKTDELLRSLLAQATELERTYLMKIIFGEMRIGVAQGLLMEGIARAADVPMALVRRSTMYLGNPGEVAAMALRSGSDGLKQIDIKLFRPVEPMLAELAGDFDKVFKYHKKQTSLEYKFDGARVQIHKQKDDIKVYSRHLTEVTASLPDLVNVVKRNVTAQSAILEGEVIAVGRDGRPLPFQELMRRFRRVHNIAGVMEEVPIKLYLFDLLYLDGQSYVEEPYKHRIDLLQRHCDSGILVDRMVTGNPEKAEAFLKSAFAQGHEGLMAKHLESEYFPGSRGKKWFKIKPVETLDLAIIAADWGSGRRRGWLSNYHLAARDDSAGEFLDLGKTFKGLTDKQFQWMTEKLQTIKTSESNYTVRVKPEMIVEVAYNEIQRSPHYNSGFALRFARIKRIREDKTPEQADNIERVRSLFEMQFSRKSRVQQ